MLTLGDLLKTILQVIVVLRGVDVKHGEFLDDHKIKLEDFLVLYDLLLLLALFVLLSTNLHSCSSFSLSLSLSNLDLASSKFGVKFLSDGLLLLGTLSLSSDISVADDKASLLLE